MHPVIFYLSDASLIHDLVASPAEVECIWTFPLSAFLSSAPRSDFPLPLQPATQVDKHRTPQEAFRTYSDVPWISGQPYRLHRFRTTQQLVKGLTADMCVHLAQDALGQHARYEISAPEQPDRHVWVRALLQPPPAVGVASGGAEGQKTREPRDAPSGVSAPSVRVVRWGDGEGEKDILPSAHKFATHIGEDFSPLAGDRGEGEVGVADGGANGSVGDPAIALQCKSG